MFATENTNSQSNFFFNTPSRGYMCCDKNGTQKWTVNFKHFQRIYPLKHSWENSNSRNLSLFQCKAQTTWKELGRSFYNTKSKLLEWSGRHFSWCKKLLSQKVLFHCKVLQFKTFFYTKINISRLKPKKKATNSYHVRTLVAHKGKTQKCFDKRKHVGNPFSLDSRKTSKLLRESCEQKSIWSRMAP